MYFFNNKALEDDLINLRVSEDEAFKYFFALSLITSFVTYFNFDSAYVDFFSNLIEAIIQFLIVFFAIKKTYSINKSGDGSYYYQRFFSLSFVVMFKTIFYALILIVPYIVILSFSLSDNIYVMMFFDLFTSLSIEIIYYYLLCKSFRRIASERLTKIQIDSID